MNNVNCINCKKKQKKIFSYNKFSYYKCINCGLVSTNPVPSNEVIKKHYEQRYKKGNYKLLKDFSKEYIKNYEDFARIIEKELKEGGVDSFNNLKVLDIGCFTGDFLRVLEKRGADAIGIELQRDAAQIAQKNLKRGSVIQADVMNHKFNKNSFDIVSMQGLVEHVNNPNVLLRRAHELLKKDGILMIQTPNSESIFAKLLGKYWPPYSPVEHIHIYSKRGLVDTLGNIGFTQINAQDHWKTLSIEYVYNMLSNFGQEFRWIFSPIYYALPNYLRRARLPFFIGEIIVTAKKK